MRYRASLKLRYVFVVFFVFISASFSANAVSNAEAEVLVASSSVSENSVIALTDDTNVLQTGYTNASYDGTHGIVISASPGTYSVGFGSYVPEDYTGPGTMYLHRVQITNQDGVSILDESFDGWSQDSTSTIDDVTRSEYSTDSGNVWATYADTTDFYTGGGDAFDAVTSNGDSGMVYPFDGGGPFSVLIRTLITAPANTTELRINLDWRYNVSIFGGEARVFSVGLKSGEVDPEFLFGFSAPPNTDPVITSTAVTSVDEDALYSYTLTATDTDVDDTLTLSAPTLPSWLSFTPATGVLTGTPTNDHVGDHNVTLRVNDGTVDVDQDFTITVSNTNDSPTGNVTIDGTVTEDQTLTVNSTALADDDGLGALSYQWKRDGSGISGATAATYTLTDADVGAAILVTVSYTDGGGTSESVDSSPTSAVVNVNDDPVGAITINGSATEDQTLTTTSNVSDADGMGTLSYQWLRDGNAIDGATSSSYTLDDADVGSAISVVASYTDGQGTLETVSSNATSPVVNVNDSPTGNVTIDGTATEDQSLTANTAGLADADGLGALSYQWKRDNVDISGAENSSYTLTDADVGSAISVVVRYTDGQGTQEVVNSSATGAVVNVNDPPTGGITIEGTATEEQTLAGNTSALADADGLGALNYQWQRNGADISGATSASYSTTAADIGNTLALTVTYTDQQGTAESVTSTAFGPIKADLDKDGIADDADTDIDGDGMSNDYELANGLDPRDNSDAALDLDGDGVSNLEEFTNESDPSVDDYGPIISGDSVVTIDAVALLTELPSGLVSANDALDGAVSVDHDLDSDLLAPGVHTITWTAHDTRNNSSTFVQTLNIRPIANWQVDQESGEDNTVLVNLYLNGPAPVYPVVANYSVSGTAVNPDDHDAASGTITIQSGQSASIEVAIADDALNEGDETVLFTLDSISNATIGVQRDHQLTISEENHAPSVQLTAALNSAPGIPATLFSASSGTVTVTADVNDADSGDSHSFVWSDESNNLAGTATGSTYEFDPAVAGPGVYQLSVVSTDDAVSPLSGSAVITLKIMAQTPALNVGDDSDGDGINDSVEGFGDSDGDNVPDFADSVDEANTLAMFPIVNPPAEGAWKVEAQPGMRLRLNVFSSRTDDFSPVLDETEVLGENEQDLSDDGYIYDGGIFDFVVSNIPVAGETVFVVMPQLGPIPADAVYRKERNGRWMAFEEDANNFITSAPGRLGTCPPPGSSDYTLGLTEGDYCVQLGIQDGGVNDADGIANGTILDPGGVAKASPNTISTGGGGAINGSLLLMLLGLWGGRLVRWSGRKTLLSGALAVMLVMLSSVSHAGDKEWWTNAYITAHIGKADSDVSEQALQAEFIGAGINNVTVNSVDDRRNGFGAGIGYRFSSNWGLEVAYLDLHQIDVNFTAISAVPDLSSAMPESGEGITFSGIYRHPLDQYVNFRARAGLFDWDADYRTTATGGQTTSVSDSDTTLYGGIGLDVSVNQQVSLTAEYQLFDFDRDNTDYFRVGMEWQLDYK